MSLCITNKNIYLCSYQPYWSQTLFCRDIFHINDKLRSKLKTKHEDYSCAFHDFIDIFKKLRHTKSVLPNIKWNDELMKKFVEKKSFIELCLTGHLKRQEQKRESTNITLLDLNLTQNN